MTTSAFERDRVRDPQLRRNGIEVLRVTGARIDRAGMAVVADIVYELGRRSARAA
jgi:very-short-patch-repair endonuclease